MKKFIYIFLMFITHVFSQAQAEPIKIVPLGDSITVGANNSGSITPNSWRKPLWEKMKKAGWNVDFIGHTRSNHPDVFDQDHSAKIGGCVQDLLGFITQWRQKPDVILLYIGANDINGFCSSSNVVNITNTLSLVIDKIRSINPNAIIFLAQIYVFTNEGRIPIGIYQNYNLALLKLAKQKNSTLSPLILVNQAVGFNEKTDLLEDHVHPNAYGEEKIAQKWFDAMRGSVHFQKLLQISQINSNNEHSGVIYRGTEYYKSNGLCRQTENILVWLLFEIPRNYNYRDLVYEEVAPKKGFTEKFNAANMNGFLIRGFCAPPTWKTILQFRLKQISTGRYSKIVTINMDLNSAVIRKVIPQIIQLP